MQSLAARIERRCQEGKRGGAVRLLQEAGQELVRMFKEEVLQEVIEQAVTGHLGRPRGGGGKRRLSPWSCATCGPRLGSELRRNGHYQRRPLVCEGMITLRIPQLVCIACGKSVPFSHPLLPRRKRLWLDLNQELATLYLEGCSYRASRRLLERKARTSTGLMSLWRSFQATGKADHAPPGRAPAHYLGLDEVYHKVRGEKRWFLSVRAQDRHEGKHWVGSVLSSDRSQEAWETALVELGISRYNPPFAVLSDGDQAIEAAVALPSLASGCSVAPGISSTTLPSGSPSGIPKSKTKGRGVVLWPPSTSSSMLPTSTNANSRWPSSARTTVGSSPASTVDSPASPQPTLPTLSVPIT